jgi:hypothetical protein
MKDSLAGTLKLELRSEKQEMKKDYSPQIFLQNTSKSKNGCFSIRFRLKMP